MPPPRSTVDLKFHATLPVKEDANYENGYMCDYCHTEFDEGPFFHCSTTGTDCCMLCASDPGTPAKKHIKDSEMARSRSRTNQMQGASMKRGLSSSSSNPPQQRVPGGVRIGKPVAATGLSTSIPRPADDLPKAPLTAKQSAPSASTTVVVPVWRVFFPPSSVFGTVQATALTTMPVFPLLGYSCEANTFGLILSDGRSIVVCPSAQVGWVITPSPSAPADALHLTVKQGKRSRKQQAPPWSLFGSDDKIERIPLAQLDTSYPWLMNAFGVKAWRKCSQENNGVAVPSIPTRFSRKPNFSPTTGSSVPRYVRWCSVVKELELTGLKGLAQGGGVGRVVLLLSDGVAQLVDYNVGMFHVVTAHGGTATAGHVDDATSAGAAMSEIVNALV